ncbi:hypothetical protein LCGC14_3119200, partial [marine sediment metagenome]
MTIQEAQQLLQAMLYGIDITGDNTLLITNPFTEETFEISFDEAIRFAQSERASAPSWWDESLDGVYPAAFWDPAWGEFPFKEEGDKLDLAGTVQRADFKQAEIVRDFHISGIPDAEINIPRPEGVPEFQDRGGIRFQYDPKTGLHSISRGKAPAAPAVEGEIFNTLKEAEAVTPPGFRPRQLADGRWVFEREPEGDRLTFVEQIDRDIDDLFLEAIRNGQKPPIDRIQELNGLKRMRLQLDEGRITAIDAFQLAAPVAANPQHLRELMDALLSESGQQLAPQQFEGVLQSVG